MTDYLELLGAKRKVLVMPDDEDHPLPVPLPRVYEDYEPIETEPPSFWELTKAHFKDNPLRWTIMQLGNKLSGSYEDPDFRVTAEDVVGYEDFPQIMNAKNEIELMKYKKLADDIMRQRYIMASRGTGANIAAGLVAGLADPINIATGFIGGGIANTGFKLFRISKKVGKVTKAAAGAAAGAPLDIAARAALEERKADTSEYVIGASVSGLMGAAFGVAPSVVRALNPLQKKKIRKAFENYQEIVTKPIPISGELPQSEVADTHIAGALGVQKLAEKVAPDAALANSEFNKAKEFGAKMSPQSFKIENAAGETVAQGATVEMLSQQAMAVDMKTFDGVVQQCFKDWLSEDKNYGWCRKTFTNWSSCNLWSGKAWKEFCETVVRHLETPDGIVVKPIKTAADFFKSKVDELTEKGLKAGVWNENFEALKTTWERERGELTKQRDVYEKGVTDTQNIIKFNEETSDAVTHSIYKLEEQIEALQDKKLRAKDLLAENAKPLSEARKDYREAKASAERAEVSGIRKFGEMERLGKANRVVDKNKTPIEAKASGLELTKMPFFRKRKPN